MPPKKKNIVLGKISAPKSEKAPAVKKAKVVLKKLSDEMKSQLKEHSGKFDKKHIASMRMNIMRGDTFDEAHNKAEMKGKGMTGGGKRLLDQQFSVREASKFLGKELPDAVQGKGCDIMSVDETAKVEGKGLLEDLVKLTKPVKKLMEKLELPDQEKIIKKLMDEGKKISVASVKKVGKEIVGGGFFDSIRRGVSRAVNKVAKVVPKVAKKVAKVSKKALTSDRAIDIYKSAIPATTGTLGAVVGGPAGAVVGTVAGDQLAKETLGKGMMESVKKTFKDASDKIGLQPVNIKSLSRTVVGKLKKGKGIRISQGGDMSIFVKPEMEKKIRKAFMKGKGITISMSPNELGENKMKGSGIFGKSFDRLLDKAGIKDAVYKAGDIAKPFIQDAILQAGTAIPLALGQPELIPAGQIGATALNYYLDEPTKVQRSVSRVGDMLSGKKSVKKAVVEQVKEEMPMLKDAGINRPSAQEKDQIEGLLQRYGSSQLEEQIVSARKKLGMERANGNTRGQGLYAGRGLGAGLYASSKIRGRGHCCPSSTGYRNDEMKGEGLGAGLRVGRGEGLRVGGRGVFTNAMIQTNNPAVASSYKNARQQLPVFVGQKAM